MLDALTAESFRPYLGSSWQVVAAAAASPDELRLIELTEYPELPAARRQAFALYFLGPPGPPMPQQTYRLEHSDFGALEIFLVPLGPRANGQLYEAVFN
jgi:hypothetical protein